MGFNREGPSFVSCQLATSSRYHQHWDVHHGLASSFWIARYVLIAEPHAILLLVGALNLDSEAFDYKILKN